MVSDEEIVIIEMSSRNGGNGIPLLINESFGFDIEAATISYALNQPFDVNQNFKLLKSSGSFVFGCDGEGTIKNLPSQREIIEKCPEVFFLYFAKNIGDRVQGFENNSQMVGFCLFHLGEAFSYEDVVSQIKSNLKVEIE